MVTTLDDAVAAPREIKLNGQAFLVSPLRFQDIGQIERWMRQKHIEAGRESAIALSLEMDNLIEQATSELEDAIDGIDDPKQRKAKQIEKRHRIREIENRLQSDKTLILDRAHEAAARCSFLSITGWQMIWSVEGMCRMTWLSLKQNHPAITLDDVTQLMLNGDGDSNDLVEQILKDSGFKTNSKQDDDPDDSDDDPIVRGEKSQNVGAPDEVAVSDQPDADA